jgi:hypothetical protein
MLEGYGEILIDSATDIPEIRTIEYIMWFSRARLHPGEAGSGRAAHARARQGDEADQADTATARDAFFAQMAAKAFGAKTDPKLADCSGTTCARTLRPPWRSPTKGWPARGNSSTSRPR